LEWFCAKPSEICNPFPNLPKLGTVVQKRGHFLHFLSKTLLFSTTYDFRTLWLTYQQYAHREGGMHHTAQLKGEVPRDLKRRVFAALALREIKFNQWLQTQLKAWLQEVEKEPHAQPLAIPEARD
jgi:hypothetical protein